MGQGRPSFVPCPTVPGKNSSAIRAEIPHSVFLIPHSKGCQRSATADSTAVRYILPFIGPFGNIILRPMGLGGERSGDYQTLECVWPHLMRTVDFRSAPEFRQYKIVNIAGLTPFHAVNYCLDVKNQQLLRNANVVSLTFKSFNASSGTDKY